MEHLKKVGHIIVTAIITTIIVWTISKGKFSTDKAYFNQIQEELEEKGKRIVEVESDIIGNTEQQLDNIEQRLSDIESSVSEIYSTVDDIYVKIIPENERQGTIDYSFTE